MVHPGQAIAAGVIAFSATNVDDLLILTVFFAQAQRFRWQQIVWGQYLGFMALVVASLPGFFGGMLVPKPLIGLLGLVPIAIGITQWCQRHAETTDELELLAGSEVPPEQPFGQSPASPLPGKGESLVARAIAHVLDAKTYSVAAVTFANGGDNIGIYVPLFASQSAASLMVILVTFLVMIAVWCVIARLLSSHPVVTHTLTRYGHVLVPIVLIGLGLYILMENGTFVAMQQLFPSSP